MENLIDYVMNLHWQTVIAMFMVGWYYSRDIKEEMKGFKQELNLFKDELKQQAARTDKLYEMFAARTDKLYEMFIDLIKEKRGDR